MIKIIAFLKNILSRIFVLESPKQLNNKMSFLVKRLHSSAVMPKKSRESDSGYDVSAVTLEQSGLTDLWIADMKIAIRPPEGWYFDLVGRSSLPTKGWHFLGGVGVIDQTYTGSLKMIMQKTDGRPLPDLPFSCGQLIPRPRVHFDIIETDSLPLTDRGDGGFGSTDKKAGV